MVEMFFIYRIRLVIQQLKTPKHSVVIRGELDMGVSPANIFQKK